MLGLIHPGGYLTGGYFEEGYWDGPGRSNRKENR